MSFVGWLRHPRFHLVRPANPGMVRTMNASTTPPPARPAWVLLGGCLLAFMASAVNADFMLGLGISISHLTGDLTRITTDALTGQDHLPGEVKWLALAVLGFLLGACAAGAFIHHPRFDLERPYGRSITAIGLLFLTGWFLLAHSPSLATLAASMACGLQNGLATHYRGLVLRTTHITGILTDLGQMTGMKLAGHQIEGWKLLAQLAVTLAFMLGAACGALLHLATPGAALLLFAIFYILGGLNWSFVKRHSR